MRLRHALIGLTCFLAPSLAFAGETVVLSPLLSKGVDAMVVMNVNSLISSELDFTTDVDKVVELGKAPPNTGCLGSTSCLSGLTSEGGGSRLVTGTISSSGDEFVLDLVLYSKSSGRILRRKEFRLDSAPESVADGMSAVIKELWTGKAPQEAADEEPSVASFTPPAADDDDDISFEDDLSDWDPEEEARLEAERLRAAEAEALRRQEEARRQREEEERRRQEAERQRLEEEERQRRAEEEARRQAESAPAEEFDPGAISFGDASGEITAEEVNDAIQFGATPASPPPGPSPAPPVVDPDEEDRRARMADLDDKPAKVEREAASFTLAVRAGGAQYYGLSFLTAGGEVTVALGDSGLSLLAGMETFAAGRSIPPELQPLYGRASEWNFIYPINAGLLYRLDSGSMAVPYVGADVIGASYFQDPPTEVAGLQIDGERHSTFGARARAGADIMFTNNVGLNVNLAVGGWAGKRWPVIDASAKSGGLLPQISAGLIAAF